jgi:hypothetical protein
MPVLMIQMSLRDTVTLRIPFRGLKPTATIKIRSATKCNGLELELLSMSHLHHKAGLTPLASPQSHQV